MSAAKWMVHIDLACGSGERGGGGPPAGARSRVLGERAGAGRVPARGGGEAEGKGGRHGKAEDA